MSPPDASLAPAPERPAAAGLLTELSPREHQMAVLGGLHQLSHVVYALGELRIADLLVDGPRPVPDLADAAGAHPSALYRVLRCAAAYGIFAELDDGRFGLTPLAEGLRSDLPGGLLPMVTFGGGELVRHSYAAIMHSVRTGGPAFDAVYGRSYYEHLQQDPVARAEFDGFMAHWSRLLADRFARLLDLGRFRCVADIGGGDGYFLSIALQRQPELRAALFELPAEADRARELLADAGVGDRVRVVEGDFLTGPLPSGCDAHVLKSVLHDCDDDRATVLLHAVHAALPPDGRLLVIDQVVPAMNRWDHAKVIDIDMLVMFGGVGRTFRQWKELLGSSGFALVGRPQDGWTVLECRPVHRTGAGATTDDEWSDDE